MAFTARMIGGNEAATLGLVNRCGKYSYIPFFKKTSIESGVKRDIKVKCHRNVTAVLSNRTENRDRLPFFLELR